VPLNATFVADFSSFLTATQKSVDATNQLTAATAQVGPAFDKMTASAALAHDHATDAAKEEEARALEFGRAIGENLKEFASVTSEFAMKYVDAFADAEQSTARLTVALKNAGAPPETLTSYEEMAEHLSSISTYSKDAIIGVQAIMTSIGGVKPDNMEATLQATMDLASFMGTGLPAAANLLKRAAESDGEAIGRLKIVLGDAYHKGMDFNDVIQAINRKFGGQAAANLETTAGHIEHLKNQMQEINERVGAVFAGVMTQILDVFQKLPDGIQTAILLLGSLAVALAPVLVSLSSLVALFSTPIGAAALAGIGAGFTAILPFLGPAGLIALGVIAVYEVWKHWDDIKTILAGTYNGIAAWWDNVKSVFGAIETYLAKLYSSFNTWLNDRLAALFSTVLGKVASFVSGVVDDFQWMYDQLIGQSVVPDLMQGIAYHFGALGRWMVDPVTNAVKQVNAVFSQMVNLSDLPMYGNLQGMAYPRIDPFAPMSSENYMPTGPVYLGAPQQWGPTATGWGTGAGGGATVVNVTMNGMLGTNDPQTQAALRDVISSALMPGMRATRLMGTT